MTNSAATPWLDGIEGNAVPTLILSDKKLIRVIAGPGSGKTTGLKRRIQRLIQGESVDPKTVFVGTFTRAVTKELDEALSLKPKPKTKNHEDDSSIEISTLHGHALNLIRTNASVRGGRPLRFLLSFERDAMLYDIGQVLTSFKDQSQRKKELKRVCAAWAKGTDLAIAEFVGEMNRWLQFHGGLLIDEVVMLARLGLDSGDIIAGQFDHVIVDEYQDLTAAEQRLITKIWSGKGSLVVLGDNDQSIYRFRSNHPGGIVEFDQQWEGQTVTDIPIPENRRSGKTIVDLANSMMAQAGSKKAPMISKRGEDGDLSIIYWSTLADEIKGLSKYVRERKADRFLILVPRRFIGYRLKAAIGAEAITSFDEEVLETPLAQERFALASFIADTSDRVALRALLGFHFDGVTRADKRNAEAYQPLLKIELDPLELIGEISSDSLKVKGSGAAHIKTRAKKTSEFLKFSDGANISEVLKMLFDPTLSKGISDIEDRAKAEHDLIDLRNTALAAIENVTEPDLKTTLDHIRYQIATRAQLSEEQEARVRIMTFHGAKGLEADIVIVAGLADQIIPGMLDRNNPVEAKEIREEQRRLLYVSVTRAKRELVVSWPKSINYKDATKNRLRLDPGSVKTINGQKWVSLGRTTLLPDVPQQPTGGKAWLKAKLK